MIFLVSYYTSATHDSLVQHGRTGGGAARGGQLEKKMAVGPLHEITGNTTVFLACIYA